MNLRFSPNSLRSGVMINKTHGNCSVLFDTITSRAATPQVSKLEQRVLKLNLECSWELRSSRALSESLNSGNTGGSNHNVSGLVLIRRTR